MADEIGVADGRAGTRAARIVRPLSSTAMDSLARRIGASVPAIGIGVALVAGLWLMPDLTPPDAIPVIGQQSDRGRVVEDLGTDATGLPLLAVELADGEVVDAVVQDGSAAMPGLSSREPVRGR